VDERQLRPHHRKIDPLASREVDQRGDVAGVDRNIYAEVEGSRVARGDEKLGIRWTLAECPGERMLSPATAHYQNSHDRVDDSESKCREDTTGLSSAAGCRADRESSFRKGCFRIAEANRAGLDRPLVPHGCHRVRTV